MKSNDPDPDGEQLKALQNFLNSSDGKKIELVWIDSACMPQDQPKDSRSEDDTAAFKRMLSEVNMLYLGTTVLILLDLSYDARFWTQFESWLAMQYAMPDGLKPAKGTHNERHHIVCIQNAAEQADHSTKGLEDRWATKTPDEAHRFLSKHNVVVTCQKDKEGQLPKIKELDTTVQCTFLDLAEQLEHKVANGIAAKAQSQAALDAFKTEHDITGEVGKNNRLRVDAENATDALAEALKTLRAHDEAIRLGVIRGRLDSYPEWLAAAAAAAATAAATTATAAATTAAATVIQHAVRRRLRLIRLTFAVDLATLRSDMLGCVQRLRVAVAEAEKESAAKALRDVACGQAGGEAVTYWTRHAILAVGGAEALVEFLSNNDDSDGGATVLGFMRGGGGARKHPWSGRFFSRYPRRDMAGHITFSDA